MSILKNSFDNISEEDEALIRSYFKGYDYASSGYTFLANYAWRTGYDIYWEIVDKYMFIGAVNPMIEEYHAFFSMPLTADGSYEPESLRAAVLEIKRRCDAADVEFELALIPWHMKQYVEAAFPEGVSWECDPGDSDYVYLKAKLISLSGRALHKKKNHMNFFKKNYKYTVKKLDTDSAGEAMAFVEELRMAKEQHEGKRINSLRLEEEAIREMLKLADSPEIYSAAIYIDGKIAALALGERLNEDTAVEHFEKARDEYRGLYQVICSEFCKGLPEEIMYVNREEDMGLENLRLAKEALRPVRMEDKYVCSFTSEVV